MATIDFPNSPTTGATFTSGGVTWTWDSAKWVAGPTPAAWTDAPSDSNLYGRENASWVQVPAVPAASSTTPIMDGTATPGVSALYTRGDHVHPTDTSRYAASNPSGYQTAAQVTASLGAYLPLAGGTITGNLTVNGQFQTLGTALHNGYAYFSYGSITDMAAFYNGTDEVFQYQTGYYTSVTRSGGVWHLVQNNAISLNCSPGGNLTVNGAMNANGIACTSINNSGAMNVGGYGINWTNYYGGHSLAFGWTGSVIAAYVDNTFVGSLAFNASDARLKDIRGDYTSGLDVIDKLQPKIFSWKGNNTGEPLDEKDTVAPYKKSIHYDVAVSRQQFVGFIAQEIEVDFPDAIGKNPGYIDGEKVEDIRSIESTQLIYAMVNAIKELKAEIDTLKAAR